MTPQQIVEAMIIIAAGVVRDNSTGVDDLSNGYYVTRSKVEALGLLSGLDDGETIMILEHQINELTQTNRKITDRVLELERANSTLKQRCLSLEAENEKIKSDYCGF